MEQTDSQPSSQCWVDIFDGDCFMGRMRRLFGPQKLRQLRAKSVIVGPDVTVVLTVRRQGRDSVVKLSPSKVVPDLAATVRGAKIRNAVVMRKT
jgi:hypothetical protein